MVEITVNHHESTGKSTHTFEHQTKGEEVRINSFGEGRVAPTATVRSFDWYAVRKN
jgi:hypothetical protein